MNRQAYTLLTLTALFWAGNAVVGKLAIGHVSPIMLTFLRWTFAAMLIAAIGWRNFRRDWPVIRRNLPLLVTLGIAGFALFNIALYQALLYTSAINVMIEQAGMPMLIVAANFLLFGQRVGPGHIIGFLLSIAGVAVTASHGEPARLLALDVNAGDALMLGAVILYAGFTVALRYKPEIDWRSLMLVMSVTASISALPFLAWEVGSGAAIVPDMRGWAVVLYTVLFPSMMSQVFYMRGVELIGGNRAGLFINLVPVLGAALSVLLLGETFHAYHAVAMVLVLGGIGLAEWSGRRRA